MAQRYSDWARQQVDRANRTLNPKARNDRLALAEYYLQLAELELAAAKRPAPLMVVRTEPEPAGLVIARSQRVRPEVAGPMTGSATKQSSSAPQI
jgi:hypothetical protein